MGRRVGVLRRCIEMWGLTDNPLHAAFLLPDGSFLKAPNDRGFDKGHAKVGECLDPEEYGNAAQEIFREKTGAIYLNLRPPGANTALYFAIMAKADPPTAAQRRVLSDLMDEHEHTWGVDTPGDRECVSCSSEREGPAQCSLGKFLEAQRRCKRQ